MPDCRCLLLIECTSKLPLAAAATRLSSVTEPLAFYNHVSPSKELRDASSEAESTVESYLIESSMRLDVFRAKVVAENNIKASGEWEKLSLEEQRLVHKLVLDGTRAGLGLPEETRTHLAALKKELKLACLEYNVILSPDHCILPLLMFSSETLWHRKCVTLLFCF